MRRPAARAPFVFTALELSLFIAALEAFKPEGCWRYGRREWWIAEFKSVRRSLISGAVQQRDLANSENSDVRS